MRAIRIGNQLVRLKSITETDLMHIESKRATVAYLKSHLEIAERDLAEAENVVIVKMENGCKVEAKSNLYSVIDEVNGPRRPEWKELYLNHMEGEHNIDRRVEESMILDTTASKPKQVLRIIHRGKKS